MRCEGEKEILDHGLIFILHCSDALLLVPSMMKFSLGSASFSLYKLHVIPYRTRNFHDFLVHVDSFLLVIAPTI